jgi:hypothetical protein
MHAVCPFGFVALIWSQLEVIDDVNPSDDEDVAILFDVTASFRGKEAFAGRNSTRFQRAT